MILFTVATVREERITAGHGEFYTQPASRCVAVCSNIERATSIVENNIFDIYEMGHYKWAVIEEIETDHRYGGTSETPALWYEWQGGFEDGKYVRIETPEDFVNVVGFGMG